MTEIMIRAWDLPTYRIHLLPPHPETHQVLPSGSHSFRICKHSYLLCLLWSFTFVLESVCKVPSLPLRPPKSPFPGACILCQAHNTGQEASLWPLTGNDKVHSIYSWYNNCSILPMDVGFLLIPGSPLYNTPSKPSTHALLGNFSNLFPSQDSWPIQITGVFWNPKHRGWGWVGKTGILLLMAGGRVVSEVSRGLGTCCFPHQF